MITEFGAAIHCKYGWVGSVVEVTKHVPGTADTAPRTIAMIHAGSDIFARQCYAPSMYAVLVLASFASFSSSFSLFFYFFFWWGGVGILRYIQGCE